MMMQRYTLFSIKYLFLRNYFCYLYKVKIKSSIISSPKRRYNIRMRQLLTVLVALSISVCMQAQERVVQNKPYIDLRQLHFGILVGFHLQDIEFQNVGPQVMTADDGTENTQTILCDADNWNPGFSVGVLAEWRINAHFSARFTPTMHFGAKHLTFMNYTTTNDSGEPTKETQDLKSTYISLPVDIKFAAERFNNYRPYIMAGINPTINLTGNNQDYVKLKRYDTFIEIGLGCDFYLPFFKLIPELKFCYSLSSALDTKHADELQDTNLRAYSNSVSSGHSKMIVLTFYFE